MIDAARLSPGMSFDGSDQAGKAHGESFGSDRIWNEREVTRSFGKQSVQDRSALVQDLKEMSVSLQM